MRYPRPMMTFNIEETEMPTDSTAAVPRPVEHFTPAIKACRDRFVDHVSHHLGVPIIGTPTPATSVGPGDAVAVYHLALAPEAPRPRPGGAGGTSRGRTRRRLLTSNVTPRHVLMGRRQLHAAVAHLTDVLLNDAAIGARSGRELAPRTARRRVKPEDAPSAKFRTHPFDACYQDTPLADAWTYVLSRYKGSDVGHPSERGLPCPAKAFSTTS
jgi:hypothetical protein